MRTKIQINPCYNNSSSSEIHTQCSNYLWNNPTLILSNLFWFIISLYDIIRWISIFYDLYLNRNFIVNQNWSSSLVNRWQILKVPKSGFLFVRQMYILNRQSPFSVWLSAPFVFLFSGRMYEKRKKKQGESDPRHSHLMAVSPPLH